MSELDRERLERMLRSILTTETEELDCDALVDAMDKIVELATAGEDVRSLLPDMALHLDHCPDCRDQYDTLTAFWGDSARSGWRPLKRLAMKGRSLLGRRPDDAARADGGDAAPLGD